ncbi:uncharacterized protein K489DRAFT_429950 [Dissoconium aciculare CBS 342.82]|uniref:Uncharacterized protein n=1 Tax=Dissoconium aciculare CBS 342.82 TaxID=1314786 RepID=A0A6J3M8J2_9PEZI|nr:uncharacterized protein K489DRAFT_429950 [Dissoconium aciculare CBS 342.82]KAF1823919.1 hypothetical protein K489DRAFT_429950 [Dissoconium aciculare CBS 342.82]
MPNENPRLANYLETRKLQLSLVFMIVFYTFTKMSFVELLAIVIFGPNFRIIPGDTLEKPPLDSPTAWILGFANLAILTFGFSIAFRGWREAVYSRPSLICDIIASIPAIPLAAFTLLAGRPVPLGELVSRVARWWWRSEELGGQAQIPSAPKFQVRISDALALSADFCYKTFDVLLNPYEDEAVPWARLATFLNCLAGFYPVNARTLEHGRNGSFPVLEPVQALSEDFLIRGLIWSREYHPADHFKNQSEDDGRNIESEATNKLRADRVLWLGLFLAFRARYLHYDEETKHFSASQKTAWKANNDGVESVDIPRSSV